MMQWSLGGCWNLLRLPMLDWFKCSPLMTTEFANIWVKRSMYWEFHPSRRLKANKHIFQMCKIKNRSVGMVLKLISVSEQCSQGPSSWRPLIKHRGRLSFSWCSPSCHTLEFPLLQEGVELSLDVIEGVFTHVVHLACFPALLPLFRWDLGRRRSCDGCRLLRWGLVKLILHDKWMSEWIWDRNSTL